MIDPALRPGSAATAFHLVSDMDEATARVIMGLMQSSDDQWVDEVIWCARMIVQNANEAEDARGEVFHLLHEYAFPDRQEQPAAAE